MSTPVDDDAFDLDRDANGVWRPPERRSDELPEPIPPVEAASGVVERVGRLRPPGFNIIAGPTLFEPLPPVAWLCQGLFLAPGAPVLVAGYGYSGKSVATQSLAICIASGRLVWGRYPTRRGRVLHLDYEQGRRLSLARYQRLAVSLQLHPDEIQDNLELGVLPSESLSSDNLKRLGEGRDLVLVDSWRAAHPGVDENSSDVRRTLDAMGYASEATGAVFMTLHHAKKPTESGTTDQKFSIRGSSGFFDGCQTVFVLDGTTIYKPVVHLLKERILGSKLEPFTLSIDDTYEGHGLAVTCDDSEKQSERDTYRETCNVIVEFISTHQGIAGTEALALQIGKRVAEVRAYVRSLVAEGLIVSEDAPGKGRGVRLYTKDYTRRDAPF